MPACPARGKLKSLDPSNPSNPSSRHPVNPVNPVNRQAIIPLFPALIPALLQ